jgi:succinoglycan biosynthesis transport protein ExoP
MIEAVQFRRLSVVRNGYSMVQAKAKFKEILWYYRWFALIILVAVLGMGYVGFRLQPKVYGVSAEIFVEPRPGTVTGQSAMTSSDDDYRQINNQVEILGSDRVASKAAEYIAGELGPSFLIDSRRLVRMINISKKEYSSVITLELSSTYQPHALMTILQQYLRAYEDALETINSDKSTRERDFLARQLELAQTELNHVSGTLRDFEAENSAYNMDTQVNQMLQVASALDEQAKVLNADIQAVRQEVSTAQKMLPMTPEYVNLMARIERDPEAGELRKRIVALQAERAEWGAKVTDVHPKMVVYDRELNHLNQLLDQRLAVFGSELRSASLRGSSAHGTSPKAGDKNNDKTGDKITTGSAMDASLAEDLIKNRIRLDSLQAKEKALINAREDVALRLKAMPQQVVAYAALRNNYEMAQEKVRLLQKRLDDASLMQEVSKRFTKVEILKNPVLPTAPLRPNLMRTMTAAGLLGLCLALFSVYIRCTVDPTFRWTFQLNGLREPNIFQLETAPGNKAFAQSFQNGTIGVPDSYKRLMVHLETQAQNDGIRRVGILPVGQCAARGLSGITLALTLTEAGHKVALLDVDFTPHSVSRFIESLNIPISAALANGPGLSDYLVGATEDFVDIIYPLGKSIYGSLIPAGSPVDGAGLPVSRRSWEMLEESLSPNYSFVFYSLPAIQESYDAVAVSVALDGVLLMVYPGITRQDQIQQSIKELKTVGARLLGIVVQPF